MTRALAHRGPDDEGYVLRGPLVFGFRRLSIIDLAGGRQPMSDIEETVWIVFNGEIYNFLDLRAELESYGHRFRTNSDTEVIIHGYKRWGKAVLDHLNGMFGLAVWDERNKILLVARDRLGIKPLYYRLDSNSVVFASEMRALLASDPHKPEIDSDALNLFLRYRYTPAPFTACKGIRKLAAGTRLVVEKGVATVERWWNFRPEPFDRAPTIEDAEETLLELYRKAVKRQLISDVPLGLLLSGGLDSGLLLALMAEKGSSWKTYSVGFGNDFGRDELCQAAQTARHFQSENFQIELTRADFERGLSKIINAVEEPIASDSIVPMYFLCQRARQDVKVALMGQGPDELFGGYRRHLAVQYGSYGRLVPGPVRSGMGSVLGRVFDKTAVDRLLSSFDESDRMRRYRQVFSLLPAESVDNLFREGILGPDIDSEIFNCWHDLVPLMADTDELGGFQFLELRSSLPDELLLYADKLSMANGLEVRVPYLDHEIVEYVERLPASFKVRAGSRKWLHRRLCRRFMPREAVNRKKIGFETPAGDWFRSSAGTVLSECLEDTQSKIYDFLRYEPVRALLTAHHNREHNYSDTLFSLSALELWLRSLTN